MLNDPLEKTNLWITNTLKPSAVFEKVILRIKDKKVYCYEVEDYSALQKHIKKYPTHKMQLQEVKTKRLIILTEVVIHPIDSDKIIIITAKEIHENPVKK